jgi:hypothetical protein
VDLRVAQHGVDTVGAQEQAVAFDQVDRSGVDGHVGHQAQRTGEHAPLRMRGDVLGSNLAGSQVLVHHRVVDGHLGQVPGVKEIGAAVSHMGEGRRAVCPELEQGQGGPHPCQFGPPADLGEDRHVGGRHPVPGAAFHSHGGVHGDPRGDLAADRSSHSVGHHHQRTLAGRSRRGRMNRILVGVAHATPVGGDRPEKGCHLTSMTVLPIWRASPRRRSTGVETRRPFT